ncbi:hypothetical protein [Paraburkholderia acidiphila]|uniref:Uncharacterized protein n=1 Tax=Paraburkholderia acidiphila TaxID=2571747 RepID=A0A7Z2J7Y8_9BURK|nr:hypothetical protein [Paraburkholderia acidiphila]QGZ55087.1 hypothetical protein FAZ97_09245 [Paraburkholderia acidiphila]
MRSENFRLVGLYIYLSLGGMALGILGGALSMRAMGVDISGVATQAVIILMSLPFGWAAPKLAFHVLGRPVFR